MFYHWAYTIIEKLRQLYYEGEARPSLLPVSHWVCVGLLPDDGPFGCSGPFVRFHIACVVSGEKLI